MPSAQPHVVIVGAGFGGLAAARALKRRPVQLTIIDRRNHHLFQPLLYQVATAGLSAGEIAYPIRTVFRRQKNVRVLLAEAQEVNLDARKVILRDAEVSYDYLVLAPGARYAYFGHDEWERDAPGLKTLEDAIEIRRRILVAFEKAERETDPAKKRALLTFAIVGGGPTGVELAGAIAEIARRVMADDFRAIDARDTRIILLEAGERILPSFPEELARKADGALSRIGVEVKTGDRVSHIDGNSVHTGDEIIRAATTLWAAGVEASPLARSLGVELARGGQVTVNADLTLAGHSEVFVIGDLARFLQDDQPLPGIAPVALQQGNHVASNIIAACEGKPYERFVYNDRGNLATIGRSVAVADFGKIRVSGFLAWLLWLFVHIWHLIGFRNKIAVLYDWAWAYFRFYRPARIIFGDADQRFGSWRTDSARENETPGRSSAA